MLAFPLCTMLIIIISLFCNEFVNKKQEKIDKMRFLNLTFEGMVVNSLSIYVSIDRHAAHHCNFIVKKHDFPFFPENFDCFFFFINLRLKY